jgi:hypothetical protein
MSDDKEKKFPNSERINKQGKETAKKQEKAKDNIKNVDSLDEIFQGIYGAVVEAQNTIEQHYLGEIAYDYFWADGKPKLMPVQLPGPDGKLTEYQVPLITLVPHQNLAIDTVQIEMQVRLSPHSDTKSIRKSDTSKIGRIRKFFTDHSKSGGQSEMAHIKIKFRGKKPPEGIARIKDQMLKMIPS